MEIEEFEAELRRKKTEVDYTVRLPESEKEIMLAAWELESPFTSSQLMKSVGQSRGWKLPTLISFLTRLEYRGYLLSRKDGKERQYYPLADRERYVAELTRQFIETYHKGSFVRLLDSYFGDREFTNDDIDELLNWLKTR